MYEAANILGKAGRKAISACVKVIIKGKQEPQQYDVTQAITQVLSCFTCPISVGDLPPLFESVQSSVDSLSSVGLDYQEVPENGHCLYQAVVFYLNQGEDQAWLRRIVAAHIETNLEEFSAFIQPPAGKTIENYINDIRNGKEWADNIELEVLMRVLGRPIVVIGPDGKLRNYDERLLQRFNGDPIFVYYNGHTHYDALIRNDANTAQQIIKRLTQSPLFSKDKNTFDIRDIKKAVDELKKEESLKSKIIEDEVEKIDEQFEQANTVDQVEWGTGFIIADGYVITNKHVIEEVESDKENFAIFILNKKIAAAEEPGLKCEIIATDPANDLALLYSPGLNLEKLKISPLVLADIKLKPGAPIFSFGYPLGYTGNMALLTQGHVSGVVERGYRPTYIALNCPLNSGNSGGPILCRLGEEAVVVGVAVQKQFEDILSADESLVICKIEEGMKTKSIAPTDAKENFKETSFGYLPDYDYDSMALVGMKEQDALNLLVLKLYKALRTHSQFNQSNAVQGSELIKFAKKCEETLLKDSDKKLGCKIFSQQQYFASPAKTALRFNLGTFTVKQNLNRDTTVLAKERLKTNKNKELKKIDYEGTSDKNQIKQQDISSAGTTTDCNIEKYLGEKIVHVTTLTV